MLVYELHKCTIPVPFYCQITIGFHAKVSPAFEICFWQRPKSGCFHIFAYFFQNLKWWPHNFYRMSWWEILQNFAIKSGHIPHTNLILWSIKYWISDKCSTFLKIFIWPTIWTQGVRNQYIRSRLTDFDTIFFVGVRISRQIFWCHDLTCILHCFLIISNCNLQAISIYTQYIT